MRDTKPNVFYADKEKMFNYVLDREIPASDWKVIVYNLLNDPNNDWIYTKIEKETLKEGKIENSKELANDNNEVIGDHKEFANDINELVEDNEELNKEEEPMGDSIKDLSL